MARRRFGKKVLTRHSAGTTEDRADKTRKEFGERFPTRDSAAAQSLATNVRKLRKLRGWTQDDLAAEVKIEQAAVSLIENGRANPTLLVLEEIAGALEVRLPELLDGSARPRRSKT
ncbi:helix-turn-helix transcriptional regulator [Bradyrhizobium sp.]|uniref:helix-turn-helix domain-containing protein n=1 Tax=Bradyrhizobium sp. TaxID=376 RepID=UPI002624CB5A|nr:helix-turn-helix transcriptional regulator [Bradyrhizobium sp.]